MARPAVQAEFLGAFLERLVEGLALGPGATGPRADRDDGALGVPRRDEVASKRFQFGWIVQRGHGSTATSACRYCSRIRRTLSGVTFSW